MEAPVAKRILIADLFSKENIDALRKQGFDVRYDDKLQGETLQNALVEFQPHVLVVRSTKVTKVHISAAVGLEAIIRAGSGYDTIDVQAASAAGVFVGNCPGKNAVAVAELVMGLVLAVDRRIADNVNDLRQKRWNKGEYSKARGLLGRRLGIIGFGFIGRELAQRAQSFGINIAIYDVVQHEDARQRGYLVAETIDELLKVSDIVSIHVPSLASTRGMVNQKFLEKMATDAVLINTSRGDIVNEEELIAHLNANKDFWYATDVFVGEPADKAAPFDNALAQHPRVYGTHHVGASTTQAEAAIGEEAYRMILEFVKTGVLPNCVNLSRTKANSTLTVKFRRDETVIPTVFTTLATNNIGFLKFKNELFENDGAGILTISVTGERDALETARTAIASQTNVTFVQTN